MYYPYIVYGFHGLPCRINVKITNNFNLKTLAQMVALWSSGNNCEPIKKAPNQNAWFRAKIIV